MTKQTPHMKSLTYKRRRTDDDECFASLSSTVFQLYRGDGRVVLKSKTYSYLLFIQNLILLL